ncbi:hypothetical protein D9M71_728210 [compost metagenome]
MRRQDVGALGDVFSGDAVLGPGEADSQSGDDVQGLELGRRQVDCCQGLHEVVVHPGKPPGIAQWDDVAHAAISGST